MKDYLESYTQILPDSQRTRILNEIQKQMDSDQSLSLTQYSDLITSISKDKKIATEMTEMTDSLDSSIYNDFISNTVIDLTVLYKESDILEVAINNYVKQNQSMLNEVNHYMSELKNKIAKLRYNNKTTSAAVSYIEGFKSLDSIYRKTADNAAEFKDRDGTILDECSINTNIGYTRLSETSVSDIILIDRPSISIVRVTGEPVDASLFPIQNAIDRDLNSFWGNIILSDGPIDVPVTFRAEDGVAETFREGAIAAFDIIFNSKQRINNITFKMFEEYQTECVAIYYKSIGSNEEDFKHLVAEAKNSSSQTIYYSFQPTNVKVLRVVFKQKNYKKHDYSIFKEDERNNELIKSLIEAEARKSLAGNTEGLTPAEQNRITGVETFKGNYSDFLKKYETFKALLKQEGFNWSDEKIKEYIKTGRY